MLKLVNMPKNCSKHIGETVEHLRVFNVQIDVQMRIENHESVEEQAMDV